ncbi:MAG: hypothetical protein E7029_10385 [Planctomycetaceae bacterium]|nr:hypothetical protein [Planctomycetaceae bacterium]
MTQRSVPTFSTRKGRRRFSQTFFILGLFFILGWHFCQENSWKALFTLTDTNRIPPDWMDKMEDIARTDRLLPGISQDMLEEIQDNAPIYAAETRSLMKIWNRVNSMTVEELRDASVGRVLFAQYAKQPGAYRGNVIRIRGHIRLIQKKSIASESRKRLPSDAPAPAPAETSQTKNEPSKQKDADFGYDFDHYYELWIQPDDAPAEPVMVNTLEIPENFPIEKEVRIPVVIDGVFFKHYLYEQSNGVLGTAPAFYAKKPLWFYVSPPNGKTPQNAENTAHDEKTKEDAGSSPLREVLLGIGIALLLTAIFITFVNMRTRPPQPQEPLPDTIELP